MYLSQSQRTIELYTELTTMICDFIGVSRIAQSTEFDYNNTKLNEFYADIISKTRFQVQSATPSPWVLASSKKTS